MLVGRDPELEVLASVLTDAGRGCARFAVVVGDAGVGITSLLAEVGRTARERGFRVVSVEAVESERAIPGAALSILVSALGDVVDDLDPTSARSLRATTRGAVDRLLPGALLDLLARAAEQSPVLVVADSAQWWDPESLAALAFVARRLSADDIAVLIAGRPSVADLPALRGVRAHRVPPLASASATVLLRATAPDLVPDVALAITDVLGGNPSVLLDAVSLLTTRERNGTLPLPDPMLVGDALSRRWSRDLSALDGQQRVALAVLAAEGSGDEAVVQAAWARVGCTAADLLPSEECHAVVLGPKGWSFPTAVTRASVFSALTPPERRAAHRAVAEALQGSGRDARYAHHLAAASVGVDRPTADELARVSVALAADGSVAAAAASAESAARLTEPGELHAARLLQAAQLTLMARDEGHAAELAEQGLVLGADAQTTAAFRRVLGVCVGHLRDTRRGVDLLRSAAAGLQGGDRLGALVDALAFVKMWNEPEASLELIAELGDLDDLEPWMMLDVGNALAAAGAWASAVPLLETGLREVDPSASDVSETACDAWADAAAVLGLADRAARYGSAARRLLDSGSVLLSATGLAMQVELAYAEGRWSEATLLNEQLRDLDRAYGRFPQYEVGTDLRISARRGDRDAFERAEAELMRVAPDAGQNLLLANAQGLRATLHLSAGEDELAEPLLRTCVAAAMPGLLVTTVFPSAAVSLVALLARTGRLDEAKEVTADVLPRLTVQPAALAQAYAQRLLAHTGPAGDADERFRAATAWNASGMHAFESARTRLEHGQWLRRRRRRSDAVDEVVAALHDFERMGCDTWAARCRDELRAAGVDMTRSPRYDATASLTAQERQVAEAAAEGLTNAEIARRMYLSPKTVELHLTHVYRKLAISGRAELVDLRAEPVRSG